MRILVTYATCHGSTAEIARRIASRLESFGDAVECLAMSEVSHLSGYEAVVAGSAIHDQDWLDDARAFVSRFAPDLGALPVWLFSVGDRQLGVGRGGGSSRRRSTARLLEAR